MTNATVPTQKTFLGSELLFIEPSDVSSLKTLDKCTKYYIRQSVSKDQVNEKIEALQFTRDGQLYVEITEAWAIWIDPDTQEKYIVNGNTRYHAYVEMQNTSSFKGAIFQPIPYRLFLAEPSAENLIRYQQQVNDGVTHHDIIQLADTAYLYKTQREEFYQSADGGSHKPKKAQGLATADLKALFGNEYSDSYITRLKKIATAPDWLKLLVKKGVVTAKGVAELDSQLNKPENNGLSFETVINSIRAEQAATNEALISDATIVKYFKNRQKALETPSDSDSTGNSTNTAKSESSSNDKPEKTQEELVELITPTLTSILGLDPDYALDTSKEVPVTNLESEMLNTLAKVFPQLPLGHRQQFFNDIAQLFVNILDNPENIAENAAGDINSVYRLFGKVNTAVKKLTVTEQDTTGEVELPDNVISDKTLDSLAGDLTVEDDNFIATVS